VPDHSWIDRIAEVTGWYGLPDETGWADVEAQIGVRLPSDFKELSRRFGNGSYYGRLDLFHQKSDKPWVGMVDGLRAMQMFTAEGEGQAAMYAPNTIFGVGEDPGLLQWGSDSEGGEYYWLADSSVDPDRWPLIARVDGVAVASVRDVDHGVHLPVDR
jgi:hypothetical protein